MNALLCFLMFLHLSALIYIKVVAWTNKKAPETKNLSPAWAWVLISSAKLGKNHGDIRKPYVTSMKSFLLIAVIPVYMSKQVHPVLKLHIEVWIFRFIKILHDVHCGNRFAILGVKIRLYFM